MNYTETLDYIHSFKANGRRPDLKRMHWLLEKAGKPQVHFPTIHIVGTNGKGSTTSYLQHILTQSGYQTGSFTSPYITRFNERMSIDGKPIPDKDLVQILEKAIPLIQLLEKETDLGRPTEFEVITLLMFLYFAQKKVDIAIIEAGIGGLLDSTNVLDPDLVICTSIGYDHTDTLGQDLLDIARHKAGVIHDKTPILLGQVPAEVGDFFAQKAEKQDSLLAQIDQDILIQEVSQSHFQVSYQNWTSPLLTIKLLGQHQENNAALAATAAHLLTRNYPKITEQTIQQGLSMATWPGRSEWFGPNIYLDGAHNPQGIASLLDVLQTQLAQRKIHILFAGLKRKPLKDLLAQLDGYDLSVTSFNFFEALPLADYPEQYPKVPDFRTWLAQAQDSPTEDLYVVTGSLYFISEVRQYLQNQTKA